MSSCRKYLYCALLVLMGLSACKSVDLSPTGGAGLNSSTAPAATISVTPESTSTATITQDLKTATLAPTSTSQGIDVTPTINRLSKRMLVEIQDIPNADCNRGEIWAVDAPYTVSQPFLQSDVVSYHSPRWSHTSGQIAYVEETNQSTTSINLINPDGTNASTLSSAFPYLVHETLACESRLRLHSWSNDDQWLAFVHENQEGFYDPEKTVYSRLYVVNTRTGQTILVDEYFAIHLVSWSPTENLLAYTAEEADANYQTTQASLKVARIQDSGEIANIYTSLFPENYQLSRDFIRGLSWYSPSSLLVVTSPLFGAEPGILYQVAIDIGTWKPVAEYRRDLSNEEIMPGQIMPSPDTEYLAWVANDLLVLDPKTWQETARIQTTWFAFPLVEWVTDVNGIPVLIFNDERSFWLYDLASNSRGQTPLIDGKVLPEGLLVSVAWEP